ncbi:hypothetical protein CROQUDRAFT_98720 [Cronartium quercuum f. sp. fusiforme G11]|uniref:Retrovirus-related Pol polyprotein from transposon TNT 1-94-like beta-barrel domain-containing protein n=1 Tax=Cronartium quercuum f. sp. fusiforme G11 TaxID=708437 RepID=A0A9P6NBY4_9BASI|nr:hypothetical protein CROQUDRAFT_98720 [Cronartium quercuum f. sp. fusiforme G11]
MSHSNESVPTDNLDSSVPTLKDDNYSEWHSAMEAFLLIRDLDGIVDGTDIAPSNLVQLAIYNKRCKFLAGFIRLKLSRRIEELLVNDSDRKDPIALWKSITAHFASTKARNRQRVFSTLFTLACDESDLQKFITDIRRTLNELAATGVKTNNEMMAYFILYLFPESCSYLKTLIIYGAELVNQTLTIDMVLNHLQQNLNDRKLSLNHFATNSAPFVRRNGPFNRWPVCSKGNHNPDTAHTESQCFQLHPELKQPCNTAAALAFSNLPSATPPAMTSDLLAVIDKKMGKNDYVLDSGASMRMYRNQSDFKTYSECSEEAFLADGTPVKVGGRGTVVTRNKHAELTYTDALRIPSLTSNLISLSYLFPKGCQLVNCGSEKFEMRKDDKTLVDRNIIECIFIINSSPNKFTLQSAFSTLIVVRFTKTLFVKSEPLILETFQTGIVYDPYFWVKCLKKINK